LSHKRQSAGAQGAIQIGVEDKLDLIIRHSRLAETIDEGGALDRVDAARVRMATRLGFLDEARSSSRNSPLGGVALQRFPHDLFCARADLECESASIAIAAPKEG
jgi:hypothetical protein